MGRLFWKFFLSILLAQVAATIGIGGAFWLRDQARQRPAAILDSGPPAAIALDAASATLRHGGLPALREMLGEVQRPQIWVLDAARRDRVWQLWTPNKALGLTGVRAAYAITPRGIGAMPGRTSLSLAAATARSPTRCC